ncbi:ATP synthase subunit I [Acidaminobacter sp. JC074]|uniref:ATP synthase subunit I n=1 Tax=Acidaminobacter sp. JC074 TaxID=2530199 RepID=UPI001F10CD52|nr:ATP synthase subunit I [Acidaminobacter sp. JC074]MCH4889341.1 ATP synthase subunit I [Acidaminobacter sp. JC074]
MESIKTLTYGIMKWVIILTILASLIFIAFFNQDAFSLIIGLVFGASIGMLGFIDLSMTLQRAVLKNPGKAQAYTVRKYFMRFVMNGIVLYVAVVTPHIHIIGTVLGMLLIKMSIMITNLFNDKQFYKNIIRGKEV